MSAAHPRGTRLAAEAAARASAAASTAKQGPIAHPRGARLDAERRAAALAAQQQQASNGTAGGTGSTVNVVSGGASDSTPATGAKSGRTLALRAQNELIRKVVWSLIIGGLVVGSIYAVRRYHLLTGGR